MSTPDCREISQDELDALIAERDALRRQLEERGDVVQAPERVEQTRLHNPPESVGNCFQAVLAGLLRIPIESVPRFRESRPWQHAVNAWLRQFGLQWMPLDGNDYPGECLRFGISGTWHEIAGKSPRGEGGHSCAAKDGALEWDPHPSETGLDSPIWWHGVFVAMRPWEVASIRPLSPGKVVVGKEEWEDFVHIRQGYCYWQMQASGKPLVYGLYVEPEHRRKGFAKTLLSLVIDRVRANGYVGEIEIEAEPKGSIPRDRLERLYTNLGLTLVRASAQAHAQRGEE